MRPGTTTGHVTSADGTRVGYRSSGRGPGVVLVQGAMADARAYRALARELSSSFTVHAVDRRGRGLSPKPYDASHDIGRDVEDVDAVLARTGAEGVFGLSSGAVITLEAARRLDRVTRAAVYEPPFYPDGISAEGIARLHAEIERGDLAAALLDALLVAGTAPAAVRLLPRSVARLLGRVVLAVDDRRAGQRATLRELLPGVRYDFHDVAAVDGRIAMFAAVTKPVLLLSGTRSPAFLRQGVRTLLDVLPDARHVEFDGLGHDGPWNSGNPGLVARALDEFLGDTSH